VTYYTVLYDNLHQNALSLRFIFQFKENSMSKGLVFSIIESPIHPNFSNLYAELGLENVQLSSMRKALSQLKKQKPDYIVAEFFYGYGNNYAGVNISNLDVLMYSLQRYAPDARVIAMYDKSERKYLDKLLALFSLHAVLPHPVSANALSEVLK